MDSRNKKKSEFTFGNLTIIIVWLFFVVASSSQTSLNYSYALHDAWKVRIYTLKNGLRVFLCSDSIRTDIAGLFAVKAGSAQDPDDATGLAHYLEHMLFKGSTTLGTTNYAKEKPYLDMIRDLFEQHRFEKDSMKCRKLYKKIDSLSLIASRFSIPNEYDQLIQSLGAKEYNALTSYDYTLYYTVFPYHQLNKWLQTEAERFCNPVFRIFHTELEAVYEEKNISMSSDEENFWHAIMNHLFYPLPYSYKTTIGTIEHLKKPSIKEIEKFFHKYYVASNMALVLCGNFHPDSVIVQIEKYFSCIPPGSALKNTVPPLAALASPYKKVVVKGKDRESFAFVWRAPLMKEKEYLPVQILTRILSNGYCGILDKGINLKSYASDVNTLFYSLNDASLMGISGFPASLNTEQIHDSVFKILDQINQRGFSSQEIQQAVNKIKMDFYLLDDSPLDKAMILADLFVKDISWQEYLNRFRFIDTITPAGILGVFRKYIYRQPYLWIHKVQTDSVNIPKISKPSITPIQGKTNVHSAFYKKINAISVPEIMEKKYVSGVDYTHSLKGKTHIYFCPNTKKNISEISLVYSGLSADSVSDIVPKLILNASSSYSTLEQWNDFLFRYAISFNCTNEYYGTVVRFSFMNEFKKECLYFIDHLMSDVQIASADLKRVVQQYENEYKNSSTEAREHFLEKRTRYHIGLEKYSVLSAQQARNIKAEWVSKFLFRQLSEPDAILAAVRPTDTVEIRNLISGSGTPENSTLHEESCLSDSIFVMTDENPQSRIHIYQLLSPKGSRTDFLKNILFYNEYASPVMFQKIREEKGFAYSAFSSISWKRIHHTWYFFQHTFTGCQADKTCDAMKEIKKIFSRFPLTPARFESIKTSMIQKLKTNRRYNLSFLERLYVFNSMGISTGQLNNLSSDFRNYRYNAAVEFYEKQMQKSVPVLSILTPDVQNIQTCVPNQKIKIIHPPDFH